MFDSATLQAVNASLEKIEVKGGKKYAMVTERVKAFRALCPYGQIVTNIIERTPDGITIRAEVIVDGLTLATGTAYEERGSSYINKTSHVENCETSAVGRALGFLGIGIDESMASAEEVANAIIHQGEIKAKEKAEQKIDAVTYNALTDRCNAEGVDVMKLCEKYKKKSFKEFTNREHRNVIDHWEQVLETCRLQES